MMCLCYVLLEEVKLRLGLVSMKIVDRTTEGCLPASFVRVRACLSVQRLGPRSREASDQSSRSGWNAHQSDCDKGLDEKECEYV